MSIQESGFKKLSPKQKQNLQIIAKKDKDVAALLSIYDTFFADSNKEWNLTITFIQRAISKAVINKEMDLDDKYLKTLWEILKSGANASKTIASAKADAGLFIEEEVKEVIEVITPETSHV